MICNRCKEDKELKDYNTRTDTKLGYYRTCKQCRNKVIKERGYRDRIEGHDQYWKTRAKRLNSAYSRASKKAKELLSNSNPIPWKTLKALYDSNPKCVWCHKELTHLEAVFDHAIPISRGGEHTIENLAICCEHCNRLKHSMLPEEFQVFLQSYITRLSHYTC